MSHCVTTFFSSSSFWLVCLFYTKLSANEEKKRIKADSYKNSFPKLTLCLLLLRNKKRAPSHLSRMMMALFFALVLPPVLQKPSRQLNRHRPSYLLHSPRPYWTPPNGRPPKSALSPHHRRLANLRKLKPRRGTKKGRLHRQW